MCVSKGTASRITGFDTEEIVELKININNQNTHFDHSKFLLRIMLLY